MPTPKSHIDRTDRRILELLQKDGRLSNKELAGQVGLAPSSCHTRVQRLQREGVLLGFHGHVNHAALGAGLEAMIMVRLERHGRGEVEAFRDHVLALAEVQQVYHVGGSQDLLVHVAVRSAEELREFVMDHVAGRAEVGHMETALIFEHRHSHHLPPD